MVLGNYMQFAALHNYFGNPMAIQHVKVEMCSHAVYNLRTLSTLNELAKLHFIVSSHRICRMQLQQLPQINQCKNSASQSARRWSAIRRKSHSVRY